MPKPPKNYNPGTFDNAFRSKYGADPNRSLVIFMQRFAARVCQEIEGAVVKGGLGLEMRLDTPRTTQDADIIISGSHDLDARLIRAGKIDLGDFMRFAVSPETKGGKITAPGMTYPGQRYRVQARFSDSPGPWSNQPSRTFTAEISFGEVVGFDEFESVIEKFPWVPAARIRVYSLPWQIAEKVHAYTDPRHRDATNTDNMRPRDLLDICRCAALTNSRATVDSATLRVALEETFARRRVRAKKEHGVILQGLPNELPVMPQAWGHAFSEVVRQSSLPWRTPADAHRVAAQFLDPVLSGLAQGEWNSTERCWGVTDSPV